MYVSRLLERLGLEMDLSKYQPYISGKSTDRYIEKQALKAFKTDFLTLYLRG